MSFDNTNRFSLWRNEDKTEENPTWADFQGTINVEGKDYWISCWKRKPDGNPKAPPLSGSIKLKEVKAEQPPAASAVSGVDDLDSIPF